MPKPDNYYWHEQENYEKMLGQTRMIVNNVMFDFRKFGMSPMVDGAIKTLMEVFEEFGQRVRGKQIPFSVKVHRYFGDD